MDTAAAAAAEEKMESRWMAMIDTVDLGGKIDNKQEVQNHARKVIKFAFTPPDQAV
jgi:hypothetical protein